MYDTFISVITLVNQNQKNISDYLLNVCNVLKENFHYYEVILINNGLDTDIIKNATRHLDKDVKKDITLLNLSKKVHNDNAIVAGLDRANGDYTIIFDMNLYEKADLIPELYRKTQENFDIVYLRYKKRTLPLHKLVFFKAFYRLMKKYSDLDIDMNMHNCRIISRRALNSILKLRENLRYMKGIFSYVGYRTCAIEVDIPENGTYPDNHDQLFQSPNPSIKSALIAIVSFTSILNKILIGIFIVSMLFSCFVTSDAILIKLTGNDMFGAPRENTATGYLVIMVSIMFSFLYLILYVFSIYLTSINREIKRRPIYLIESIQRIE
jgi:hypothetical protein